MGFFKAIVASAQQLLGMEDTAFQQEMQEQMAKTTYLEESDRECDYLLEISQVTQRAPKCILEPVSPMDLKVQVFGFYNCVDFRKPCLFISVYNQGQFVFEPNDNRTNYVKFGPYFQRVSFAQVNLTGISLSRTHGLTSIKPSEAIMLVCHGDFTTYYPDTISLALNYDRIRQSGDETFKDSIPWVCQNHPVIT